MRWWPLSGAGIDRFGEDGRWSLAPEPCPAPGAIVAAVEAVTICASDAKMVRLGGVVAHALAGTLSPDLLMAAVGGFPATRDAIAAVLAGRFSGKVMILPALDWSLMTLGELFVAHPDLKPLAGPGLSWSKAIEDAVLGS